jgi:hypothetical protein
MSVVFDRLGKLGAEKSKRRRIPRTKTFFRLRAE